MKRARLFFLLLLVLALLLIVPSVYAAANDNYCFPTYIDGRCLGLMQVLENMGQRLMSGLAIGIMRGISEVIWIVDRAAAFIFSKSVTDNSWLMNLKDQMLNMFSGMMPGLLQSIAFGRDGLMYIAISIAGLLMMIPMWASGARFVRAERVMLWGILLSMLFVGGSFGYDFINMLENYRQGLVTNIVQGTSMPLDRMIQQPMLAGDGDIGFDSDLLRLPPVFDSTYFSEPQLTEVTISEGGGFGFGNAFIETTEAIRSRLILAGQGVFYAIISLFGAWLLLLVGFTYVVLAFTALLLIVFLFAALPLGFFEVGGLILNSIMQRYFQVAMQSLALAIFLRWLAGGLGYIVDVNTVQNSLTWLVVLVVMIVVTTTFLNGSIQIMMQSGQVFSSTVNSTFGGPGITQAAGNAVSKVAGGVSAVALLAGRPDVALAASAIGSGAKGMGSGSTGAGNYEGMESVPVQRGNVFTENGGTNTVTMGMAAMSMMQSRGTNQAVSTAQPAAMQASNPQPMPVPQTQAPSVQNVPEVTLQAISARQGWDAVQVRQVEEAAKKTNSPEEAMTRLQSAPGFERADAGELRKAVDAARMMK